MKKILIIAAIISAGLMLSGCATSLVNSNPKEITFVDAMTQVSEGLNKMYDIGKDHPKSGLTPTELTIEFHITASASDSAKLAIVAGPNVAGMAQLAKAEAGIGSEIQTDRSNKITIKFTNLFLSSAKDSLAMAKKPSDIEELLKVLKQCDNEPVYKLNSK